MMEEYVLNIHLDSMKPHSHVSQPKQKVWIYAKAVHGQFLLCISSGWGAHPWSATLAKGPWGWDCLPWPVCTPCSSRTLSTHGHTDMALVRPWELDSMENTALFWHSQTNKQQSRTSVCHTLPPNLSSPPFWYKSWKRNLCRDSTLACHLQPPVGQGTGSYTSIPRHHFGDTCTFSSKQIPYSQFCIKGQAGKALWAVYTWLIWLCPTDCRNPSPLTWGFIKGVIPMFFASYWKFQVSLEKSFTCWYFA